MQLTRSLPGLTAPRLLSLMRWARHNDCSQAYGTEKVNHMPWPPDQEENADPVQFGFLSFIPITFNLRQNERAVKQ